MKTIKSLSSQLLIAVFMLSAIKNNAQVSTCNIPDQILAGTNQLAILGGLSCYGTPTLTGLGVNTSTPAFMVDVWAGDINTSSAGNNVAYRIGAARILWYGGNTTDLFVGINAGPITGVGIPRNTCIGNGAGPILTGGMSDNTLVGYNAGFNLNGTYNTFIGSISGYSQTGSDGGQNTYVGYNSGYSNVNTGFFNAFLGANSGNQNQGSFNTFLGDGSATNNIGNGASTGAGNTVIGSDAMLSNISGNNNTSLGYLSDITGNPTNASAIGYSAIATTANTMILGNNSVNVGIGMSGILGGPTNKLEISYSSLILSTYSTVVAPVSVFAPGGAGIATGASGLQFKDLTSSSVSYSYVTNQNFLTLDNDGNVVLMAPPPAVISGTGSFGICPAPGIPASEGLDLSGFNLYFVGNNAGLNTNDIYLGYGCGTLLPRDVKLAILEQSTSDNSIGLNVENTDPNAGTAAIPQPTIGLRSYLPSPAILTYYNVAGWFQADDFNRIGRTELQYAIFVPSSVNPLGTGVSGGTVDIGYSFALDRPDFLLDLNGRGRHMGAWVPSDIMLKTNVIPFNYGLKVIRNLNLVSYKYNGIGGFDSSNIYIGLIAQNLAKYEPNAVLTSIITKDTITYDTATILNIYEEAVMYTAVNAIKQLDSSTTVNQNKDSILISNLQQTVDSLRSAFQSVQNCLAQLCPVRQGHSAHHNDSIGSSTATNTQDVTLSGLADTPLLYQNNPNPFGPGTGTIINYYLPEGTKGAEMLFFDTYGQQMKTATLSQTGNGTLKITPDNLSAGIYSYSLVVGGKVIDTKRMLFQK